MNETTVVQNVETVAGTGMLERYRMAREALTKRLAEIEDERRDIRIALGLETAPAVSNGIRKVGRPGKHSSVLECVERASTAVGSDDVVKCVPGLKRSQAAQRLCKLAKDGRIQRVDVGFYKRLQAKA